MATSSKVGKVGEVAGVIGALSDVMDALEDREIGEALQALRLGVSVLEARLGAPVPPLPKIGVAPGAERVLAAPAVVAVPSPPRVVRKTDKVNGSATVRQRLVETAALCRERGTVSKAEVAKYFKISESGAYQRLRDCAERGLVDHAGIDEWKGVAAKG